MRLTAKILFLSLAIPALSAGIAASRNDDPNTWHLSRWIEWRDDQIGGILAEEAPGGPISRQQLAERCASAAGIMNQAQERLASDQSLALAMAHFRAFVSAEQRQALKDASGSPDHCYGMDVPDRDYLRAASNHADVPSLLRSAEFLRLLTRPSDYSKAVEVIEAHNRSLPHEQKWKVVLYRSQFVRSVDQVTYGRLLVVIPNEPEPYGGTRDRWIQFGIATPDQATTVDPRSVSVVSVRRSPGEPRATCYLVDYLRATDPGTGEIEPVPTALISPDPSTACFSCHKSGVIPIRPMDEYGFDPEGRLTPLRRGDASPAEEVDRLITGYGKVQLAHVREQDAGPSLGLKASDEFVARTVGHSLPSDSLQRVRAAMDCGKCHDAGPRLNYPVSLHTDSDEHAFRSGIGLAQSYIEKGWMPPGNTLSPDERHLLWKCVMSSYYDPVTGTGKLVDWLKGNEVDIYPSRPGPASSSPRSR